MYRFLLSRRWLGLLAAAVLVALACVALGVWQVERLGQRHVRNDLLADNLDARPVPPADLLAVGRDIAAEDEYARVRASGRYDPDRRLLVRTRPFEGQVGYYVIVPLVTDPGPALLVNRGWVPAGPSAAALPDVPAPPPGTVTVTARVRPSEPRSRTGTPPPGQVTRIDVPTIAATLPYATFGGYVDLTAEDGTTARRPQRLPPPEPSEGPHLAYAFQWFVFAAMALGGYALLARREAADRRAAGTDTGTRSPIRVARPARG